MSTAQCPHCNRQIQVPEKLAPGQGLTCPWCLTDLTVELGPGITLSYASIEEDMMWDDDEENEQALWGDDDDDDDDDGWGS